FKQRTILSRFGVASADFVLADEVNMGTFTLRAVLPQGQAEKKVRVERYVLPKFKVRLTTDRPYYLPGDRVRGTVQADYFFGKPVAGAQVRVSVSTLDIGVSQLGEQQGETDANGTYHFEYTLPASLVGQPLEQGKAVVEFHGAIKDTAEHTQDVHTTVPVVQEPVSLVLVPESPTLVSRVPNRVYISAATPDGAPLKQTALEVRTDLNTAPAHLVTDDLGLATFTFTPGSQPVNVSVRATDAAGHVCTAARTLQAGPQPEGILLRADKTLARVGERLNLTVLCSAPGGTVYLDVLRDRQTILTRAEPLRNGEARLSLPVTDDMTGTLEMHAYKILPNEDIIRDTRRVVVSPAGDLSIRVRADEAQYRPGGDAVLRFLVEDAGRHPVAAALGLAMVDESVFALSELQPGLEKVVFTLEKELMEPKYEIHGLEPAGLLLKDRLPAPPKEETARQRAAAMVFAAIPASGDFDYRVNTYTARWEKIKEQAIQKIAEAHRKILNALALYRRNTGDALRAEDSLTLLVERGYLRDADLRDPWGNYYRSNLYGRVTYETYFTLSSAGPDGRWGTPDDLLDISSYPRFRGGFGGMGGGGFGGRGGLLQEREVAQEAVMDRAASAGVPGPEGPPGPPAETLHLAAKPALASGQASGGEEPVRVRSYFPETMYWNPALITDDDGRAEVRIPLADSITTWRLSMMANSVNGWLGSATAPIKVFQDFFVDIDLPIALTQNDRVDIPVAVYNYLPTAQDVILTMTEQPWFTLNGPGTQVTHVGANSVTAVTYSITVKQIGHYALTVTARGSRLSDAVRRAIEVLPDGKEVRTAINDRLEGTVDKIVTIPAEAIPGASTIWVKLYPGAFSQVVEGLDGLLRMPNGCFEQTSSTTYPNVLVLDYLKQTKHINPELQMKAEGYINVGYQRLVTFECKSGGFSWFGDEPAHQILTAYGLLEFSDMARVHDVDPALIQRTQRWLAGRQKPDGTWEETNPGIAEGIINRQTGALRSTAYVAWALAESGYQGPEIARGVEYVRAHLNEAKDPYTLAVILNLFTVVERDGDTAARVANNL
ncbi:MAG TPA: alpha-2-macroglobulin family protein, partial [Chthonomonadaceae bacterium]|nr:alpha-2-macroglobulin family protein [Chthonomonadaceae bacterium]